MGKSSASRDDRRRGHALVRSLSSTSPDSSAVDIARTVTKQFPMLNVDTVRRWVSQPSQDPDRGDRRYVLSDCQDRLLVTYMAIRSTYLQPVNTTSLDSIIRQLAGKSSQWRPLHVRQDFLHRWKHLLKTSNGREMKKGRTLNFALPVGHFVEVYSKLINSRSLADDRVYNVDETQFDLHSGQILAGSIFDRSLTRVDARMKSYGSRCSVVPFVNAAGQCPIMFYVYQGRVTTDGLLKLDDFVDIRPNTRARPLVYYLVTETGRITGEDWDNMFTLFCDHVRLSTRNLDVVVTMDNLGAHLSPESLRLALDKGIDTVFFPKNTTHFTQPLDNVPFAVFKKKLLHNVRDYVGMHGFGEDDATTVMKLVATDTLSETLKVNVIQAGFRNTGIWPFDSDCMLRNAIEATPGTHSLAHSPSLCLSLNPHTIWHLPINRHVTLFSGSGRDHARPSGRCRRAQGHRDGREAY